MWDAIKIIWAIICHAPQIWSLITDIIKMINEIKDAQKRAQAWNDLNAAAATARETGDTSDLEKVFKTYWPAA